MRNLCSGKYLSFHLPKDKFSKAFFQFEVKITLFNFDNSLFLEEGKVKNIEKKIWKHCRLC